MVPSRWGPERGWVGWHEAVKGQEGGPGLAPSDGGCPDTLEVDLLGQSLNPDVQMPGPHPDQSYETLRRVGLGIGTGKSFWMNLCSHG